MLMTAAWHSCNPVWKYPSFILLILIVREQWRIFQVTFKWSVPLTLSLIFIYKREKKKGGERGDWAGKWIEENSLKVGPFKGSHGETVKQAFTPGFSQRLFQNTFLHRAWLCHPFHLLCWTCNLFSSLGTLQHAEKVEIHFYSLN